MSKYDPLTRHLKATRAPRLPMTFEDIEAVLGFPLPKSARRHRPWWSNELDGAHVQARAWRRAGYQAADVDMEAEKLVFVQLNPTAEGARGDHPLWGILRGTVSLAPGTDLTAPMFEDAEIERSADDLARLLAEGMK